MLNDNNTSTFELDLGPDVKTNYKRRFQEAIRRLNTNFGMDLRTAGGHGWIYVLRYVEYHPRSPFVSKYRGYKEAALHYEQVIAEHVDAEYATAGY